MRELKSLRESTQVIEPRTFVPGENLLAAIRGDLLELEAEIAVGKAKEISLDLRGVRVDYNVAAQSISWLGNQAALPLTNKAISLHIFVDRATVDIFGGGGVLYMPVAKAPAPDNQSVNLSCQGGGAKIVSLQVHQLKSAWK